MSPVDGICFVNPGQANVVDGHMLGFMQISKPVRKHASPADRQRILQAYRHTPLSQREFATQVGASVATLNQWRRQSAAPPPPERPQFVALPNLLPNPTPGPIYCLVFPSGLALEVRHGFTAQELAMWLQLLPRL